jgi:hypothetical protein
MKYAVEMGSSAMTHTKFHKDWFSHTKVERGGYTDSMEICIMPFSFFQNEDGRLITVYKFDNSLLVCKTYYFCDSSTFFISENGMCSDGMH